MLSRLIFNNLFFLNVCKQTLYISHVRLSQNLWDLYFWKLVETCGILFSCEDKDIVRFSNLH